MSSLAVFGFDYDGKIINRRQSDGYIDLTSMCAAGGKRVDNFLRLKSTQDYVRVLDNSLRSEGVYRSAIDTKEGIEGGTWAHPTLAINCARWISPGFAIWCDRHIFTLMSTGETKIGIEKPLTTSEQLAAAGLPEDWPIDKYPLGIPAGEKSPIPGERPGSLARQEIELTIKLCEIFGKRRVTPEEAVIVASELIPAICLHFRGHGRGWSRATIIREYTFGDCWHEYFFKEPVIGYFRFNPLAPRSPRFADRELLPETSRPALE
jgi:hypothetical protein